MWNLGENWVITALTCSIIIILDLLVKYLFYQITTHYIESTCIFFTPTALFVYHISHQLTHYLIILKL